MKNKNNRLLYYINHFIKKLIPGIFYRKLGQLLFNNTIVSPQVIERVNYYNKLNQPVTLSEDAVYIKNFSYVKPTSYYFDLIQLLYFFPKHLKFKYLFGDVTTIPSEPAFVKSRPINGQNANSVLLKLNKIRHFIFIEDHTPFSLKKNELVWRGNVLINQEVRQKFISKYYNHDLCNIGHVNDYKDNNFKLERMTIEEQLQSKFILSLEGNDVATNLKWILSSNSIAVMPTPRYETWFMEGSLIPDHHYIHIKDDFSDLNEKLEYYLQNPEKAEQILQNARNFVDQFKNRKREKQISLLVLKKYFDLTN